MAPRRAAERAPGARLRLQAAWERSVLVEVDEEIAVVREAYRAEALDIDWQAGDALLLDNMTVAHGRRAFTGDRRVLVAMTDLVHSGQSKVPAPQELEL